MNNQKNKNEERIDLSQFPIGPKKEPAKKQKRFNLEDFKKSWQRMEKKNQIFTIIIIIAFILIIILLILLFGKMGEKKVGPGETFPPAEYAPSVEYPLSPGEKYTPPFP